MSSCNDRPTPSSTLVASLARRWAVTSARPSTGPGRAHGRGQQRFGPPGYRQGPLSSPAAQRQDAPGWRPFRPGRPLMPAQRLRADRSRGAAGSDQDMASTGKAPAWRRRRVPIRALAPGSNLESSARMASAGSHASSPMPAICSTVRRRIKYAWQQKSAFWCLTRPGN